MKVSIITVTLNSAATLRTALESVSRQDYADIEHILVDGASRDQTVEIIRSHRHVARFISEPDNGLYDAINKGIRMASGDVVGILNSDDFFPSTSIVSRVVEALQQREVDAVFGDVVFVTPDDLEKTVRVYSSRKFHPRLFAWGYMPAHPTFYVKRRCYEDLGLYQTDYRIAADYELLMRFIHRHQISYAYVPLTMVHMRTGGVSNKTIASRYLLNREIVRACKENGVATSLPRLSLKYFVKIFEYIRPAISSADTTVRKKHRA
jgi:glycosyltransferase involved in cell wall biosynthesis